MSQGNNHEVYELSPGVAATAFVYETAERVHGVPAELSALVVSRHGGAMLTSDTARRVMTEVVNVSVATGVEPLAAAVDALAGHQGERISA